MVSNFSKYSSPISVSTVKQLKTLKQICQNFPPPRAFHVRMVYQLYSLYSDYLKQIMLIKGNKYT